MGKHSAPRRPTAKHAVFALAAAIVVTGAGIGAASSLSHAQLTLVPGDKLGVGCTGSALTYAQSSATGGTLKCTSATPSTPSTTSSTTSTTTPTSSTTPTTGGCAKPDVYAEGDGGTYGPYFVHNNAWNWSGPGTSQHETLSACGYGNWTVTASGMTGGDVKTYPNVHLDVTGQCCAGKLVSGYPNIIGDYAGVAPKGGIFDVAWDVWLNGVADNKSTELMVWTQNGNQTPAGSVKSVYVAGGVTYDVWWDGAQAGGYIAFVPRQAIPSGSIDLKAMFAYSASKGYLAVNPTVNQIDYGVEFCDTAGATQTFTVTNFNLHLS